MNADLRIMSNWPDVVKCVTVGGFIRPRTGSLDNSMYMQNESIDWFSLIKLQHMAGAF